MFSLELHYFSIALYDVCLVFGCLWTAEMLVDLLSFLLILINDFYLAILMNSSSF